VRAAGFMISPNPVTGSVLTLTSRGTVRDDVTVRIVDMAGREWYKGTISAAAFNRGRATIHTAALAAGEYILRIVPSAGEREEIVRFWRK